jgi:hypothetical protein
VGEVGIGKLLPHAFDHELGGLRNFFLLYSNK